MNTNIDNSFIPDENLIQDLANRLFKGPEPHYAGFGIPPSVGGAGVSPGSFHPVNEINLNSQEKYFQNNQDEGTNKLPHSVAGSGISPSAHHQGNEVNLEDPQTALKDPHFQNDNKVPASVAGSGISPSIKYLEKMGRNQRILKEIFSPK